MDTGFGRERCGQEVSKQKGKAGPVRAGRKMERSPDTINREVPSVDGYMAICFPLLAQDVFSPRAVVFFPIQEAGRCEEIVRPSMVYLPSLASVLENGPSETCGRDR